MVQVSGSDRRFLFLQGPHGPWFHTLAGMLRTAGAEVWRVGFNAGDRAFWFGAPGYIPFRGRSEDWPGALSALIEAHRITDIVLYGDTRPVHAEAVAQGRQRGLTVHVFEEGYLRPYWVTYERGGSNGHSRLVEMSVAEMQAALARADPDQPVAPARWGEMRQHVVYGALYHTFVLFRNGDYRNFRTHRAIPIRREFALHLRRLLAMPFLGAERALRTAALVRSGHPYHVVLLQLEHDASFRTHGPFATMADFLATVIEGFARGAPEHHRLVFKAHPLEDGRAPIRAEIARLARAHGVARRVTYLPGGKLARVLAHARSAVTVNSTAAQQVLFRGIPLKAFGTAVYSKPEFVSDQPLHEFFAAPRRPDVRAYRDYRLYLLETSQIPGGFYSSQGRRSLLRQVVDMMLSPEDPYDALSSGTAAPRQQLRLVT